jgi:hypothetical protein
VSAHGTLVGHLRCRVCRAVRSTSGAETAVAPMGPMVLELLSGGDRDGEAREAGIRPVGITTRGSHGAIDSSAHDDPA